MNENDTKKTNEQSDTTAELEKQAERFLETNYITGENAVFKATDGGFASLEFSGKSYDRVNICRAFPFSAPDEFISVREPGDKAYEIGIIRNIKDLSDEQTKIVLSQINLRYFTPKIQKILNIKEEYGYSYWDTVTDKGACRFTVSQGSVAKISDTRAIVTDIDGNRFEIPDINLLSAKELRMIDLYL